MLRSILLALHDTAAAGQAAEMAFDLAGRHDAHLTGVAVVDVPYLTAPEGVPLGGSHYKAAKDAALLREAERRGQALLARFADTCARLRLDSGAVLYDENPFAQILRAAAAHDLIVIGRDTTFHIEPDGRMGEPVSELLRANPRPLIVTSDAALHGSTALIAYDGSVAAMRALQLFVLLRLCTGWQPRIVCVGPRKSISEETANSARSYLARHGFVAEAVGIVSDADPAEILLAESQHTDVRLLVMGAFGHRGLRDAFLGSCTRSILAGSEVPLFVHH